MFIVLEGLDGAGKSTQIGRLRELLAAQGVASEYLHFPRFDAPVYGELIARFLRGELGSVDKVDRDAVEACGKTRSAFLDAVAARKADAAPRIRQWLDEGKAVLLDRYVYSNVGYQCAKLPAGADRDHLGRWILDLEFGYNRLPRPDVSLFLDVPFAFTERKLAEVREGDDRTYLNGAKDIHEGALDLQRRVREVYLSAAAEDPTLRVVECSDAAGAMDTPEGIFDKIRTAIEPLLARR